MADAIGCEGLAVCALPGHVFLSLHCRVSVDDDLTMTPLDADRKVYLDIFDDGALLSSVQVLAYLSRTLDPMHPIDTEGILQTPSRASELWKRSFNNLFQIAKPSPMFRIRYGDAVSAVDAEKLEKTAFLYSLISQWSALFADGGSDVVAPAVFLNRMKLAADLGFVDVVQCDVTLPQGNLEDFIAGHLRNVNDIIMILS